MSIKILNLRWGPPQKNTPAIDLLWSISDLPFLNFLLQMPLRPFLEIYVQKLHYESYLYMTQHSVDIKDHKIRKSSCNMYINSRFSNLRINKIVVKLKGFILEQK